MEEDLDRLEKEIEDSGTFDDWRLLLHCSIDETAFDRKESIENGEEGDLTLWATVFPFSLFKYRGANIGGGTGNNDGWCATSLTFKLAAANTAAGDNRPSLDVDA